MTLRHSGRPESVSGSLALLRLQTEKARWRAAAGVSSSTCALCQRRPFRRLSPPPPARLPGYLHLLLLRHGQVLLDAGFHSGFRVVMWMFTGRKNLQSAERNPRRTERDLTSRTGLAELDLEASEEVEATFVVKRTIL